MLSKITKIVFVFGSNKSGIHGKGAAKEAKLNWGATHGVGEGFSNRSYAIPTKGFILPGERNKFEQLDIREVGEHIDKFINFAYDNNRYAFLVTKVGCGLAGFEEEDIADLFKRAKRLGNVYLPYSFLSYLGLDMDRMSFNSNDRLAARWL